MCTCVCVCEYKELKWTTQLLEMTRSFGGERERERERDLI